MRIILNGRKRRGIAIIAGFVAAIATGGTAQAVPSYARQTGLACEACHTVFPQLTPFGRVFKASGYTLSNTSKVQDIDRIKHYLMSLSDTRRSRPWWSPPPARPQGNDADSCKTSTDFPSS